MAMMCPFKLSPVFMASFPSNPRSVPRQWASHLSCNQYHKHAGLVFRDLPLIKPLMSKPYFIFIFRT